MKAIVYDKGASPEVLVYRDVEKPIPGDNEVLVKIYAAAVNAADYRSIKMGSIPKSKIFGSDIAGIIEAAGKNISRFKVGDAVFGDISGCGLGGFAEYVAVPETPLALIPTAVSFETAAAVPMSAVTALQGLRNQGHIKPGQKILIYGAGGGVGTYAVQLAKSFGAEVTAVCSEHNAKVVQSLGADRVIDYQKSDLSQSDKRFNLIVAINGSNSLATYKRLLSPGGTCVVVGGALTQVLKAVLFGGLLSLGSRKIRSLNAKPNAEDLAYVIQLVAAGKLKPVVERVYTLDETPAAVRYLSGGHASGKVIIKVIA